MAGEEDKKDDPAVELAKANDTIKERDRSLAIERAARSEAERRGTLSAAEASRLKQTLDASATGQVDTAIAALKTQADSLKKDYSTALGEGDFDKAADLQMQMSAIAAKLTNAEGHKAGLEHQKANPPAGNGQFDKEGYIARQTARTAAWLRSHDEYFTDPALQARVQGAHHLAVGNDIKVDSDEYFTFIEKQAGMTDEPVSQAKGDSPPHQAGPRPGPRAPAAPPTREGVPLQRPANLRPGDRFIPAEMRSAAELCGNTPEQYHDEYVRLVKEGRITDKFNIVQ